MAIIQSSVSSDSLIIDPITKAARVTLYDINGNLVINSSSFASAFPTTGTANGFSDGTNMRHARVFDIDIGAGSEYVLGASIRLPASGGSVIGGTLSDPIRTDPTGITTQPVSLPLANAISSIDDFEVTIVPTALPSLAAGPTGILITSHQSNTIAIRVSGSDVSSVRGQRFISSNELSGTSFIFSVTNANVLHVVSESGTGLLCISAI